MSDSVRVVRADERVTPPGPATAGMDRRLALAADGIWLGTVQTEPGVLSGRHHHGDYDTYVYVLAGDARLDYDTERGPATATAGPGDFIHIPKGIVHREGSAGPGVEAVLIRVGEGQVVFNVDVPEGADPS